MATSIFNIKLEGISDVIAALKLVERRFLELEKKVGTTGDRLDSYEKNLKRTGTAAKAATNDQDRFSKGLDTFNQRLTVAIQKIITYRLAFGVFREATETFQRVVDITIEMDDKLGDLRKVLFATSDDFAFLERSAFELGKEFGRSAGEVADSFLVFAQQGLNVGQIFDRTRATLALVSGSTISTKEAVEVLTAAANNFGRVFENNLIAVVDKFTKVAATAPVTATDLANALKSVGSVATEVGLSIDELNGIVASIAEVTRKSGKNIGNSLKTIFARIRRPEVIEQLDQLGISSRITVDQFRPLADVLTDLQGEWAELSQVQRFNLAVAASGIRRYNDFLALMSNFDQFVESNIDSQLSFGFAQQATEAETAKLSRQFQSLNTSIAQFGLELGQAGIVDLLLRLLSVFTRLINTFKGSARTIVGLNAVLIGLAGVFVGRLGLIRLFGTLSSIIAGTFTATLGSVVPIVGAIVIALNALFLAFDSGNRATKELSDSLEVARQRFDALREENAKLEGQDVFNEIVKERRIRVFNAEIAAAEAQVKKLSDSLERTPLKDFIDAFTDINFITAFLTGIGNEFDELGRIISVESRQTTLDIALLTAGINQARAEVRKLRGEEVLPELLQERELTRVSFALAEVQRLLNSLSVEAVRNAVEEGRDLRFLGTEIEGIQELLGDPVEARFIDPQDTAAITSLRENLEKTFAVLLDQNEKLRANLGKTTDAVADQTIRLAREATDASVAFGRIERSVDGIRGRLDLARQLAEQFNEGFSPTVFTANELRSALEKAVQTNSDFVSTFEELRQRAVAGGIDINATLRAGTLQLTKQLTERETEVGLLEDLNQLAQELIKADREKTTSTTLAIRLQAKLNELLGVETDELERIRRLSIQERIETVQQTGERQKQIDVLRTIRGNLSSINGTTDQIRNRIQQQLALDTKIAEIERDKKLRVDERAAALKVNLGLADADVEFGELAVKNAQTREKFEQAIVKSRLQATSALIQQNQAIRQQIGQIISGGLANLPFAFAERRAAEEELAVRRLELEEQLQQARQAGDQSAINRALQGLAELEQEGRRIGSVFEDVFNIFAGVAELRLQRLSEVITEQLLSLGSPQEGLDLGEFFADNLLQGTTEGAIQLKDGIVTGTVAAAAIHSGAILEAIILGSQFQAGSIEATEARSQLSNKLLDAHTSGATLLEQSLNAAFQFGSVLIGQAIGGGGARAASGASLGGLLGGAFGQQFLGGLGAFAGPVGILGGSILGGLLGGIFDDTPEAISTLNDSLDRNTQAIENNNRLLELRREFINAPARFVAPPTQGEFGGGVGPVSISVTVAGGSNPQATAQATVDAIDQAFNQTVNNSGARTPFRR